LINAWNSFCPERNSNLLWPTGFKTPKYLPGQISTIFMGRMSKPAKEPLNVYIRKLREKFGDRLIKTIKGVGYKFDPNT
jgi:hypothetical protein